MATSTQHKPTHHYDRHGYMLYEGDLVEAEYKNGRIYWDATRQQWMLDFDNNRIASMNLYSSRQLILIGRAHHD